MRLLPLLAIGVGFSFVSLASAQTPRLRVNGVGAATNGAIAHAQALHELRIELRGTPGAALALLVSADAFDGDPVSEPVVTNGPYLKPFVAPGVNAPMVAILDGIGAGALAGLYGVASGDVVSTGIPVALDAQGDLAFVSRAPAELTLPNTLAPAQPLVLPLESTPSATARVFLQAVERDPQTNQLRVGNGVIVVFDALDFPVTIAYSEGTDANPDGHLAADHQSLGTITDANLGDATLAALAVAPDFGGAFAASIDIWNIELAGTHEFTAQSHLSGPTLDSAAWLDPDNTSQTTGLLNQAHRRASAPDFLTGERPALDVENAEFPRIRLPGGRQLFHWRQDLGAQQNYGFGILFESTGEFRNLVPATFGTFAGSPTLSPWEWEVGVSPDGNFALVCLDPGGTVGDRAFLLDLRPIVGFAGGVPIVEVTPAIAADATTIQEESFEFLDDGQGSYVAYFASSIGSLANLQPNRLSRVSVASPGPAMRVLPTATLPFAAIVRVDRQFRVSPDGKAMCLVAGNALADENVLYVSNVTPAGETITNLTAFSPTRGLAEWGDARAQQGIRGVFSQDGSRFAFPILDSVKVVPAVARTDGSDAGTVTPLVAQIPTGLFDLIGDFKYFTDYVFTRDNSHLVALGGTVIAGAANDRFDLFAIRVSDHAAFDLTRTINPKSLLGPFDATAPTANFDRPTIDPTGSFLSDNGEQFVFVRDAHGIGSIDNYPFDRANFVAVDLRNDPQTSAPSLRLTNITGAEFEPTFGVAPPNPSNPDVWTTGTLFTEPRSEDFQLRRVPSGVLAGQYVFTARNPAAPVVAYDLYTFDANQPSEAVALTNFASTPGFVNAAIRNVVPHPYDATLAFSLDKDGPGPLGEDVFTVDAGSPATLAVTNSGFTRFVTGGSLRFTPTNPTALLWADGSIAETATGTTIDGVTEPALVNPNPIDAGVRFYRFALGATIPAQMFDVTAPAGASLRRSVQVWSVAGP